MFELDQYEPPLRAERPAVPGQLYKPDDNIDRISLLSWGEHCMECAAPACYSTCDLYQARPDKRCRRFRFGIYRNPQFPSFRGYGAEVSFKKWAVLAAMGNTSMAPKSAVLWAERAFFTLAPALNLTGRLLGRVTRDDRWASASFVLSRRLCRWLHARKKGHTRPDAFLLEIFNPAEPVRMQLLMAPDSRSNGMVQIRLQFRTTLECPSGYSRHEIDSPLFRNFTESDDAFLVSLAPEADACPTLVFLSADFITYKNKDKLAQPAIKCVVWDLDNTLWDGTLLENDDVKLRDGVHSLLETLDGRGILLSIVSKNNHEAAWKRLQDLGIAEYFVVPQINWQPKSENIRTIARKLNIGIDSLAFVDDNPFELDEVRTAIPAVTCIDSRHVNQLWSGRRFQGSTTADARNRRRYYQEAIAREEAQAEYSDNYIQFLEQCRIALEVIPYASEHFERVAELVQRTNQLNFSGHKYGRDQLSTIVNDAELEKYVLWCSDRFGAYGLIGFAIVRHTDVTIDVEDFMLSCRVQGRFIEKAFFAHLERHHNSARARLIRVRFTETNRNQPAKQSLEAAQFTTAGDGLYRRETGTDSWGEADIITVTCSAPCHEGVNVASQCSHSG